MDVSSVKVSNEDTWIGIPKKMECVILVIWSFAGKFTHPTIVFHLCDFLLRMTIGLVQRYFQGLFQVNDLVSNLTEELGGFLNHFEFEKYETPSPTLAKTPAKPSRKVLCCNQHFLGASC